MSIPATERRAVAERHGLNEQYLYQCLTGRADLDPAKAVEIEAATQKGITRQMLRQSDYWLIWPDLPAPSESVSAEG
ncbi:MAG TPA: hypothetical protein VGE36_13590 [Roseateles sp.]